MSIKNTLLVLVLIFLCGCAGKPTGGNATTTSTPEASEAITPISIVPTPDASESTAPISREQQVDDNILIKDAIKAYFDADYLLHSKVGKIDTDQATITNLLSTTYANDDALSSRKSKQTGMLGDVSPIAPNSAFERKYLTTARMSFARESAQPDDLSYDRYDIDIQFKDVTIEGDTATIEAFVEEAIYFNLDSTFLSECGVTHIITMNKIEGDWFIVGDDFYNPIHFKYDELEKTGCSDDDIFATYMEEVREAKQAELEFEREVEERERKEREQELK